MDATAPLRQSPRERDRQPSATRWARRWASVALAFVVVALAALSSGCIVATARIDGERHERIQTRKVTPNGRNWRLVAVDQASGRYRIERQYLYHERYEDEVEILERRSWPVAKGRAYWVADVFGAKYIAPLLYTVITPVLDSNLGAYVPLPILSAPRFLDATPGRDRGYMPHALLYATYTWGNDRLEPHTILGYSILGAVIGAITPVPGAIYGVLSASPLDICLRVFGINPRRRGNAIFSMITPGDSGPIPFHGHQPNGDLLPFDGEELYSQDLSYVQNLLDWPLRWLPGYPGFTKEFEVEYSVVGSRIDTTREQQWTKWQREETLEALENGDLHIFVGREPAMITLHDDASFTVSHPDPEPWNTVDGAVWMWWEDERGERRRDFSQLEGTWAKNRERLREYEDRALDTPRIRLAAKQREAPAHPATGAPRYSGARSRCTARGGRVGILVVYWQACCQT